MWTFELMVTARHGEKPVQRSPLRFNSREAAEKFGLKMFEPPLSVLQWAVVKC